MPITMSTAAKAAMLKSAIHEDPNSPLARDENGHTVLRFDSIKIRRSPESTTDYLVEFWWAGNLGWTMTVANWRPNELAVLEVSGMVGTMGVTIPP